MMGDAPEVLVVGAGPVGLFTALSLARRDVRVQIVDTGVWPCKHSYALALHPEALALLEEAGLKERALAGSYPVRTMALYADKTRKAEAKLGDGGGACLAVLRQDVIEDLLEKALKEHDVRVQWRHEVSELEPAVGHVKATIDKFEKESRGYVIAHSEWSVAKTFEVEAPIVVGADGYDSAVRRALNFDFPEVGPAQYFAVFEFKTDADLGHELKLAIGENTTDALWPLPGGYCRWSFELPGYHDEAAEKLKDSLLKTGIGYFPTERLKDRSVAAGQIPVLEEAKLRAFLAERAPWFTGSIEQISWRTVVRFERRLAPAFGQGRMWLAGDAAHLTGPVGIQSMNLGLFEGRDLAVTLAKMIRGGAPGEELDGYSKRWSAVWRQLHGLDGGLKARAGADPWVAQHARQLLPCLPAHGAALTALAGQLGLDI
jgi:2-polyprenyl-6-methoxyphenol hydroxylase-like FAD-dependent oxidoreductase